MVVAATTTARVGFDAMSRIARNVPATPARATLFAAAAITLVGVGACGFHSGDRHSAGAPDADASMPAVDAYVPCHPEQITSRFFPAIAPAKAVELRQNPSGKGAEPAWVFTAAAPVNSSFSIPYHGGDRIIGLAIDVYRHAMGQEVRTLDVLYKLAPDSSDLAYLGFRTDRVDLPSMLGRHRIILDGNGFKPTILLPTGVLWVELHATPGYWIGHVTATFERGCEYRAATQSFE